MDNIEEIAGSLASIEEICKYIQEHNIDKKGIIENRKFQEKLYKELGESNFSYSCIRSVVETFGVNTCIDNLDIDKIKDLNSSYRYIVTLSNYGDGKKLINKVALDDKYYDYFLKNIDNCYSILENASYDDVRKIIGKVEKDSEKYKNLNYFYRGINNESKEKLLKEDLSYDLVKDIVSSSNKKIQQSFISNDPRALTMCKDFNILKMAEDGIHFPTDIMKQDYFFEKLKADNFVDFRRNINRLYRNNYSYIIQRKVDNYRESIINSYDKEKGIFKQYDFQTQEQIDKLYESNKNYILDGNTKFDIIKNLKDKYKLNEYLKNRTSEKLSEVIIDSLFNDTKKNVSLNINEMLKYNNHLSKDKKVLDSGKSDFYSIIKNLDNIPNDKKIDMYKELKEKNVMADFYNDISKLKEMSYQEINDSLFKAEDNIDAFSIEESNKNDIGVYDLSKKSYYLLVRVLNRQYHEGTNNSQSSYSLISDKNLSVFDNATNSIIYVYDKVDPKRIINVYEGDSYTVDDRDNLTNRVNRIASPKEIVESNSSFSEINIANEKNKDYDGIDENYKYKEMRPTGILSMGEITKEQIEECKRLNIPLLDTGKVIEKNKNINQVEEEQYDKEIN